MFGRFFAQRERLVRWLSGMVLLAAGGAVAAAAATGGSWWLLGSALVLGVVGALGLSRTGSPTGSEQAATWSEHGRKAAQARGTGVTFADVAGLEEVLSDLNDLVRFIRDRDRYLAMDAQLPRGVLLYGPPGTGKTLLAKALASEADAHFIYASGASFVEKYVGVGAQRVRAMFQQARKHAPAIVFIDEIDAVGRSRSHQEATEWDSTLNQLLVEIDGFATTDNVLVVAATNRRELLDPALLRPGRLDRQIFIGLPDLQARVQILQAHTRNKPLAEGVDLTELARRTPGLTGAHLAAITNEATLAAVKVGRTEVTQADLMAAMERVLAGTGSRGPLLQADERRWVALHEAGHAVAGWAFRQGSIERISLLPRSQALAYVLQIPEERSLHTRSWLLGRMATMLAGRAAEEIACGEYTTGAADDLKQATLLAQRMVCELGMSRRWPHQTLPKEALVFSDQVAAEVADLVAQAWRMAQSVLRKNWADLEALAAALVEREVLDRADVEALLARVEAAVLPAAHEAAEPGPPVDSDRAELAL